ncbi:MAG: L-glutamate gamma-semialdehyde dehydrogenase, partial [Luteimonas sp.]|nr:L-glutamate gamma-semialdehyde dehydrogenase [Luteimonas sp.]
MSFRLTYATMYNPPEAMHERFEAALARVEASLGGRHPLFIGGTDRPAKHYADRRSPIDSEMRLGAFALADADDADTAMVAARAAYPDWCATPAAERA